MPADAGYVRMDWSYGARTDMTVLTKLQAQFSKFGQQVYGPAVFQERPDDWEAMSSVLKDQLAEIVNKYRPETT